MMDNILSDGILLLLLGVTVTFAALFILMNLMKGLKYLLQMTHYLKLKQENWMGLPADTLKEEAKEGVPGIVIAAIAITLILEEEQVHDEESMVLTLHAIPKPYNNWWMAQPQMPLPHTNPRLVRPISGKTDSTA